MNKSDKQIAQLRKSIEVLSAKPEESNSDSLKKLKEDLQTLEQNADLKEVPNAIAQKKSYLADIGELFRNESIGLLVSQSSQLLQTLNHNSIEMMEQTKFLINMIFDCFIPELLEEIQKKGSKSQVANKEAEQESKYVQMEPLTSPDFDTKTLQMKDKQAMEVSNQKPSKKKIARQSSMVFRDVENASTRLTQFSNFCNDNKELINKLVHQLYTSRDRS